MIAERYGYQIIHMDAFRGALYEIYPELGITEHNVDLKFKKYMRSYIKKSIFESKERLGYIFEGADITAREAFELFFSKDTIFYCLIPIGVSIDEFANKIRENDTPREWTYEESDEDLMELCCNIMKTVPGCISECKKYGIPYIA